MWKKIIYTLLCMLFIAVGAYAKTKSNSDHLSELKKKFPYVLLDDDYGVLSIEDLATNACGRVSEPFSFDNKYSPSLYWQCFESKVISLDCESNGVPDKSEGILGLVVIKTSKNKKQYRYIEHRLWPIKDCKQLIRDASKLVKGTNQACIAGSFIEEDESSGKKSISWFFERIKTKRGCEGRDCEFTKKFQQENCPDLKL